VRRGRTRILVSTHETPVPESLRNPDADLRVAALLEKMRFAAGAELVDSFNAQLLAEQFLGDTIGTNIIAMGYAWQCGLIPVGLEALLRAIELNEVAVEMNKAAFHLGRLAAAAPQELARLRGGGLQMVTPARTLDELVEHRMRHLEAYQDAAYARRYRALVDRVRAKEAALRGSDGRLALTEQVALSFAKLLAYKDEYEVARLYTDGGFRKQLEEQFEGDFMIEFQLAPPLFAHVHANGQQPRKKRYGPWMMGVMRLLAKGKALRGTRLDLFGRTAERRMERALAERYEHRMLDLLPQLSLSNLDAATELAALPQRIRGFGHVKAASVALAAERETELLHRFDPQRYPRVEGSGVVEVQR
jgi:indolepyruvate ferredoxin oxidoreductase